MKVTVKYAESKRIGCLGISVCVWWVDVYCANNRRYICASYGKPTARQLRRWKKQAKQFHG